MRDGLLQSLLAAEFAAEELDLQQMVSVARLFADQGDAAIKDAIYPAVVRAGFEMAAESNEELVCMDGIRGLVIVSDQFPSEPDDFSLLKMDQLLRALDVRDGEKEARQAILAASNNSDRIRWSRG